MSKVLYKRTGNPEKEGWYVTDKGRLLYRQMISPDDCWWKYCKESPDGFDHEKPTHWYSETPPPELAEVLEKIKANINNNKEYSNFIRIPIQYAETLLNELIN